MREFKLDFELMRLIAIYWVIYNHTDGYYIYRNFDLYTMMCYVGAFFAQFCKFSVPVFLMISGALLLGKAESLKKIYMHRISRMATVLFTFSVLYYLLDVSLNHNVVSFNDFFIRFYHDNWNTSFWYLWTYIAYLMLLPFLRPIASNMTNVHFMYMVLLMLIFDGVLPIISFLIYGEVITITSSFTLMGTLAWSVTYPLLGYCVEKNEISIYGKNMLKLFFIDVLALLITSYLTMKNIEINGVDKQTFFNCFVIINALTMYMVIKSAYRKWRGIFDRFANIIIPLGRSVFGAYLIHISIMIVMGMVNLQGEIHSYFGFGLIIDLLIYCSIIFGLSIIVGLVMKKIPIVKGYL